MSSSKNKKHPVQTGSKLFYGSGLVIALIGVMAISMAVESASFLLVAASIMTAGHFVSSRLRMQGRSLRIVETVVIAICLATYARLFATGDVSPIFNPGTALFHKELSLAVMLVWAEVVRSFSLVSDEAVLFSAVPSLALIGVVATANPSPDILIFFTLWLCASIVMFMESGRANAERRASAQQKTVTFALVLGITAVISGYLLSPVVQKTAMWGFFQFAPSITATTSSNDIISPEIERNVLEISDGPVRLSDREVMRVRSSIGTYWRSRVWEVYSGRDWKSHATLMPWRPSPTFAGQDNFKYQSQPSRQREDVIRTRQEFTSSEGFRGFLYAAAEPSTIWVGSDELYRDTFNNWRLPSSGGAVSGYSIVSDIPAASPQQLREASTDYPPHIYRFMNRNDAPHTVRLEAERVTRGLDNPLDKILALKGHLSENYSYDLKTPPLPANETDAVRYFLFESRRGYCDVFASALAVMARSLGIPSRIASGFMTGEYDPARDEYIVRQKDRHAWVEIYFPEYGWIPFEATPADNSTRQDFWESLWMELKYMWSGGSARVAMFLALLGIGLLSVRMLYPMLFEAGEYSSRRSNRPELKLPQKIWKRLAHRLHQYGISTGSATTPSELSVAMEKALGDNADAKDAVEAVRVVTDLLTEILYSGRRDISDRIDELETAYRAARMELKKIAPSAVRRSE